MLSSNLSATVGSPNVWVGTPDVVRSSDAYVNYKSSAKLTLWINKLTTSLPSGLVKMLGHSLNVEMPPNRRSSPHPKMKFEREREKQYTSNIE